MRAWQERAIVVLRGLRAEGRRDILVTACPGSGKTTLALRAMHDEIASGRVDKIIVVVPTLVLKRQWAAAAQPCGLRLCGSWGSDAIALPADAHGVVLTFQQVARLPEAVRVHCARCRVLAVFDELHHAGDGRSWGMGLREAFEQAVVRLGLSGTPWRGDVATIPFTRYDDEGRSLADVTYSYSEALADGVARELFFFAQGAQVRWLDSHGEHEASFADDLDADGASRRLRTVLDTRGDWLPAVLRQAQGALSDVHLSHPEAKAFCACMDAAHARAVAELLTRVTGERPVLALGDDPEAGAALEAFRRNRSRWLVVCKLGNEGYDCPGLRVLVWATNAVGSELFFRQMIARTIRVVPGLPFQDALVFLPSDPRLLAMARQVLAEREQALGGPQPERAGGVDRQEGGGSYPLFVPLESRATAGIVVSGGATIPPEALQQAQEFKVGKPDLAHLPVHFLAGILRHLDLRQLSGGAAGLPDGDASAEFAPGGDDGEAAGKRAPADEGHFTYDELRQQKRRTCSRLAAVVARAAGIAIEEVHRECHRQLGVRQGVAALADLERKEALLKRRLLELGALR